MNQSGTKFDPRVVVALLDVVADYAAREFTADEATGALRQRDPHADELATFPVDTDSERARVVRDAIRDTVLR